MVIVDFSFDSFEFVTFIPAGKLMQRGRDLIPVVIIFHAALCEQIG